MASDINVVSIVGRLTRDCIIRYSTAGTAICTFSIANTQSRKDGDRWIEEGHFFDCVGFGRRYDALSQYLTKGTQVVVQGSIQQNRWQDKETGQNRSKVQILCNDIQLVGGNRNSGSGNSRGGGYNNGGRKENSYSDHDGFDDDIPF